MGEKSKTSVKKTKQKKAEKGVSKKRVAIIVVIAVLLASIAGGAAVWLILANQQPEMSDWAEVYLSHIKTVRDQDKKLAEKDDAESDDESFWNDSDAKPQVSFYESENNSPTMVVNYTTVENNVSFNSVAVYSTQNEEIYLLNYENTNLYYVYDIDASTYNFYLKYEGGDENTYIDIDNYFKDPESDEKEYETECSTEEKAENYCGDVFVEEDVELPSFEYSDEMSNKELAEAVADTSTKVVTEAEVKEETGEKLQASAEKAKERIKQKEEAKEFFMVGDQKVRFGKYESMGYGGSWSGSAVLTLNPDFTATRKVRNDDTESGEAEEKMATTKFEVRPIRHGDVYNLCFGDGCPEISDRLNGYIGIIMSEYAGFPFSQNCFLTQAEAERASGNRTSPDSAAPASYDFTIAYGHSPVYYRFLGK